MRFEGYLLKRYVKLLIILLNTLLSQRRRYIIYIDLQTIYTNYIKYNTKCGMITLT